MTDVPPPGAPASGVTTEATFAGDPSSTPPAKGSRPRARRGTRWRAAFFALAGAGIIAAVVWALLGDRVFIVRSVTVTGTHLVAPARVIAAADVGLGTPLVRVNAVAVAQRVEAIRQVASATVTKDWPDHVAIVVTERVPAVAVRMAGGGYDLVDPTGTIVRWARTRPAKLPLLTTSLTGSALRGDRSVAATASVLSELGSPLAAQVSSVRGAQVLSGAGDSVVTAQQVTLSLRDGKTVVWGEPGDAAQKNREVAILLRGSARYIDVSAPGTAVTR